VAVEPAPAAEPAPAPVEPTPAPEPPAPAPEPEPAKAEASVSTDDLDTSGGDGAISVGLLLGLGTTFDSHPGGVDPFGFGFGVRGGYRLMDKLTVGGRFVNYVGSTSAVPTGSLSMSAWLLAAEASYDLLELGPVTLQPGVALGIASRSVDGPPLVGGAGGFVPGVGDATHTGLYLAPGATAIMPLLDMFFVGADMRLGFIIGDEFSGDFELLLTGGARF
jgi:hypothetical protein